MGYVRAYEPGDEVYIAACLRQADRQELQAVSDRPIVDTLREGGISSCPSCTIVGDSGLCAGMFGVVDEGHGSGRVWMVGTDEIKFMRRQFLEQSKNFLVGLERQYKVLHNHIDERNTLHVRWLRWMGFTFINRVPEYGVQRLPFLEFIKPCANPLQ